MRKTNRNIKRVKFFKRFIVTFLIGQMIFFCLFIQLSHKAKPIDIQDCKNARIVVEKKETGREFPFSGYGCRIFADGIKYNLPNPGSFGKYSLNKKVEVGETLDIIYCKVGFFKSRNYVVAVEGEDGIYLDFDWYNAFRQRDAKRVMIVLVIIELVFLSILTLWFISASKELKFFSKKKKKKRKAKKQSAQVNDVDGKTDSKP